MLIVDYPRLFTTFPDWKTKYFYHFGDEPLEEFLLNPKFRAHAGGVLKEPQGQRLDGKAL